MQRRDGPLPVKPVTAPPSTGPGTAVDSHFDDLLADSPRRRSPRARRRAPSRGEIVLLMLLCGFGLLALARALSLQPTLDARWGVTAADVVELVSSPLPELRGFAGVTLLNLVDDQGRALVADAELLNRMPRWTVGDAQRARQAEVQLQLHEMLRHGPLRLQFEGGREVRVQTAPRGLTGLGPLFWLLGAVAMALVAVAASVLRLHASPRNLPYALIGLAQAANLLLVAVETLPGLGLPAAYVSGYLRTVPPPGKARLEGADATHAWVDLWCGEADGWIGFDPTNALVVAEDHIILAIGRDYSDVAPIGGIVLGPGEQTIKVGVDVIPEA